MDGKIELVPLAVSDVDRAVAFDGELLAWSIDHDQRVTESVRFVQVTPRARAG